MWVCVSPLKNNRPENSAQEDETCVLSGEGAGQKVGQAREGLHRRAAVSGGFKSNSILKF